MKNNNRRAVTVRFNLVEQQDLRSLAEFLKVDEARALKVSFLQMIAALKETQKKLKEKENESNQTDDSGPADNSSPADPYVAE